MPKDLVEGDRTSYLRVKQGRHCGTDSLNKGLRL
jgi:hypothetical protein